MENLESLAIRLPSKASLSTRFESKESEQFCTISSELFWSNLEVKVGYQIASFQRFLYFVMCLEWKSNKNLP